MADNPALPATGEFVATDEIAGAQIQWIKLKYGADGFATAVDATNPLPVIIESLDGRFITYEDATFVTGDSPATHDVNADLGRDGRHMQLTNDGAGSLFLGVSNDGATYSSNRTVKTGESIILSGIQIDSIKITWIADCGYRILVF